MHLWLSSLLGSGTVASAAACWIAALLWASLGVSYRGEWIVRWVGAGALQALVIHAPGTGFPISAAIAHAARNGGWGTLLCLAIFTFSPSLPPSLPPALRMGHTRTGSFCAWRSEHSLSLSPPPCLLPYTWGIRAQSLGTQSHSDIEGIEMDGGEARDVELERRAAEGNFTNKHKHKHNHCQRAHWIDWFTSRNACNAVCCVSIFWL
jgi:hypothetical protein